MHRALFATALLVLGCDRGAPPLDKDSANAPAPAASAPGASEVLDSCPHGKSDGECQDKSASEGHSCGGEAVPPANHFGSAFAKTSSEPLRAAAPRVEKAPEVVQVSGVVESVCQKAGCWMVLKDGDTKARIFTKGHGFFLPRDIAGKNAVVEGELAAKRVSEKFAKHLEEDRGGDPSKVKGEQEELVMNATAVALR
jgi:hypothetical protein